MICRICRQIGPAVRVLVEGKDHLPVSPTNSHMSIVWTLASSPARSARPTNSAAKSPRPGMYADDIGHSLHLQHRQSRPRVAFAAGRLGRKAWTRSALWAVSVSDSLNRSYQPPASHPARSARKTHPLRARIQAQGLPRAARRAGRAYRAGVRLHPADHRDQAVHGPRRAGHGPARVPERAQGVPHSRQRLGPSRPGHHQQAPHGAPERDHYPYPDARLLAEQTEIFFSVIQKKVVTPNDFASLGELSATLLAFISRYNQTARPFSGNSPRATCAT